MAKETKDEADKRRDKLRKKPQESVMEVTKKDGKTEVDKSL